MSIDVKYSIIRVNKQKALIDLKFRLFLPQKSRFTLNINKESRSNPEREAVSNNSIFRVRFERRTATLRTKAVLTVQSTYIFRQCTAFVRETRFLDRERSEKKRRWSATSRAFKTHPFFLSCG